MLPVDTLNRLLELATPATIEVAGVTYKTGRLERVLEPAPDPLVFGSLHELDAYTRAGLDTVEGLVVVHILNERAVELVGPARPLTRQRFTYARAEVPALAFPLGSFVDQEAFLIGLQTQFTAAGQRDELVRIVGSLTGEEVRVSADDGISQEVSAKAGVHLTERATIKNPVHLAPFRTFREVEQPTSPFVLRVRQGRGGPELALFEADGGTWKLPARDLIAAWCSTAGLTVLA